MNSGFLRDRLQDGIRESDIKNIYIYKQANKTEKVPVKDKEEGSSNGSRQIQTEIQL